MSPRLAGRLSRAIVGCYPPRWQRRYREEILDVLDQHRAGPRTVLSLAGGAMTAHLDPDYRMERPVIRIKWGVVRAIAQIAGVTAGGLALIVIAFVLTHLPNLVSEASWHPGFAAGVSNIQFTPDRRLMVSSVGQASNGTATLFRVVPAGSLRRLSVFEGGPTAAISPDGRLVATVAFGGQPALWSVASPRHPRRLAVLSAGASGSLWGEAFSPDGTRLAAASSSGLTLWDVSRPARPRLLRVLSAPVAPHNQGPLSDQGNGGLAFSPDGKLLASASGDDQITIWNVDQGARATAIATITGPHDYFVSLAFSPDGRLLAGLTYHGKLLVYRMSRPSRPVRAVIRHDLLAGLRYPNGAPVTTGLVQSCGPRAASSTCDPPGYAMAFAAGGRSLTVVINLDERGSDGTSSQAIDTVRTWMVTGSGALGGPAVVTRDGYGGTPGLDPGARLVANGTAFGSSRPDTLWALPVR